jgi:glutamate racemase
MLGVFDSGMGGLTFVKEIKRRLPNLPIVYFGDTARCPWGNKSADLIKKYTDEITAFLIEQGIENIAIACNTGSAFASDYLRKKYTAINFYDVIDPVISKIKKEIANLQEGKKMKIGIIGTKGTIENGIYERKIKEIDPQIETYSQACPLFVPLVEENMLEHPITKMMAKEYLQKLKDKKIDILVLGCTHYPLLKNIIQDILGEVKIIDSAEEMAEKIAEKECLFKETGKKSDIYYFSDLSTSAKEMAEKILGQEIVLRKMTF